MPAVPFMMFFAGVQQILLPYMLACYALLGLFLFCLAKSSKQVLLIGLVYTGSIFLGALALRIGFDVVLVQMPIRYEEFFFVFGFIFLVFGLGFCWDWIQCLRSQRQNSLINILFFKKEKSNPILVLMKIGLVFALGLILILFGVFISPSSELIVLSGNVLLEPGRFNEALFYFACHDVALALPALIMTLVVFGLSKIGSVNEFVNRSYMKMLFASLYLSIGVALIYLY